LLAICKELGTTVSTLHTKRLDSKIDCDAIAKDYQQLPRARSC